MTRCTVDVSHRGPRPVTPDLGASETRQGGYSEGRTRLGRRKNLPHLGEDINFIRKYIKLLWIRGLGGDSDERTEN